MLQDFFSHCYIAPVQFDRVDTSLIITNDAATSRGTWMAWWDSAVKPGQIFQLLGTHDGGHIKALFFITQADYMHSVEIEPGAIFEIPEDAAMLRIDLRLWDEQGMAIFKDIDLVEYTEPEPDPDPDPEPDTDPVLPVPEPVILEERYWVGYKWGRNIFITDTADDTAMIPADRGDAYEIQGVQRNRNINLEIGNIIIAEPDKDEEETNE